MFAIPALIFCSRNLFYNQILDTGMTCEIHGYMVVVGCCFSVLLCLGLTILRYSMVVLKKELNSLKFPAAFAFA
ncbi:hypothetical protein HDU98_001010, partial [Podochytrium sp. JEL0797]